MADFTTSQTSFSAGELDPKMRMRSDVKLYGQGCRKARNVMLHVEGGASRRWGTIYIEDLIDPCFLDDYRYSDNQNYLLSFSDTKLRIYAEGSTTYDTELTGCPWTSAILKELSVFHSGDTIVVCHQNFWPQKILRTGAATFTIQDLAFEDNSAGTKRHQPYFKFLNDAVTMTPSATTGSISLTASADVFDANHVGTYFRLMHDSAKGYKEVEITAVTDAQNATATVRETLDGTTAVAEWDEQAFSVVRGYPATGLFHGARLGFAGTPSRTDGFWMSKADAYFNFDVGDGSDADAIDHSLRADDVAEIRHLVSSRNIQIFTDGGEGFIPESSTKPLTPGNIEFRMQTPYGAKKESRPIKFDGGTLFVQDTGRVVREYLWTDTEQAYSSGGVTLVSGHLIQSPVDSAMLTGTTESAEQLAFFPNTDGTMAVFHSVRQESLAGWVLWETDGKFESIATVGDSVYVAVRRTINGVEKVLLEKFDTSVSVDCAYVGSGASSVNWTAAHLPNTTVQLVSDTYYLGEVTTDGSGNLVSPNSVTDIVVGLDYTFRLETMPVDTYVNNNYPTTGSPKKINRVVVSFYGTVSASISGNNLILRQAGDDFSQPPTAREGENSFYLLGWDSDQTVVITQNEPLPIHVRGLYMEVSV